MDEMVEGAADSGAGVTDGLDSDDAGTESRARWAHLTDEEFAELMASADDPEVWAVPVDDGEFIEPIIGWSVVFPKAGSLAELLFRSEAAARRAAAGIPDAVVSAFRTPDASWHHWEDPGAGR